MTTINQSPATKEEAIQTFKALVAAHGTMWTGRDESIPKEHWIAMRMAQKFLNDKDRREALGLPT